MEERIRAEIKRLTTERDEFVPKANQQIAAYNGAIAALQGLLEPAELGQEAGPVPYENTDPMRRTVPDSDMRAGAAS